MKLYSPKEVAKTYQVSHRSVQRWRKRKEVLQYVVYKKGCYFYKEEALPILKSYAALSKKDYYINNKKEIVQAKFLVKENNSLYDIIEMSSEDVRKNLPKIYILYKDDRGKTLKSLYFNFKINYPKGYNYVYLLEEEGYVGITNNLKRRIREHYRISEKNISRVRLLGVYKDRVKAHFVETLFHYKGYKGYSGN